MTNEKLYEVLGDINEKHVNEAREYRKVKKPIWIKWTAMAACLCLVIVGAFFAPNLIGEHGEEPPISSPAAIPYVKINDTCQTESKTLLSPDLQRLHREPHQTSCGQHPTEQTHFSGLTETLDTYAHVTTAAQKEAPNTMGNVLAGTAQTNRITETN